MISSISIENFKAFGKKQKLSFKPITLIFGPNSSGKSSLIHSLLFVQHALKTGELDVFRTVGGGESVDLGGFKQFIFGGINRNDLLTWSVQLKTANMKGRLLELLAPAKLIEISASVRLPKAEVTPGEFVYAENPIISSFFISADNEELFSMGARKDNTLRMERLNYQHPVFRKLFKDMIEAYTTIQKVLPEDFKHLKEIVSEMIPEMLAGIERFIPQSLLKRDIDKVSDPMLITVSRANRKEDIHKAVDLFLPRIINDILGGLYEAVSGSFENLAYLGPLRSYPPRHLAFLESEDLNWYAGGGFAWEVLRKNSKIRKKVNAWLGDKNKLKTPYQLLIQNFYTSAMYDDAIQEGLEKLVSYIANPPEDEPFEDIVSKGYEYIDEEINKASKKSVSELILKDLRTNTEVSHRDVGIGISQIIPVLVSAYANKNKIIAIEQPEIHIHPGLQAELGDLFIESALGNNKNTFLLESHSEHLLLRIMRRMRETAQGKLPKGLLPVTPNDVCVVYVEPLKKQSIVKEIPINEQGELVKAWPGGFFEEGLREVFA